MQVFCSKPLEDFPFHPESFQLPARPSTSISPPPSLWPTFLLSFPLASSTPALAVSTHQAQSPQGFCSLDIHGWLPYLVQIFTQIFPSQGGLFCSTLWKLPTSYSILTFQPSFHFLFLHQHLIPCRMLAIGSLCYSVSSIRAAQPVVLSAAP
jgi:hypothetical protein